MVLFCFQRCREEDPTLETRFKSGGRFDGDKDRHSSDREKTKSKKELKHSDHGKYNHSLALVLVKS